MQKEKSIAKKRNQLYTQIFSGLLLQLAELLAATWKVRNEGAIVAHDNKKQRYVLSIKFRLPMLLNCF